MEKPENNSHLPKVTQEDLDAVYLEELSDENHIGQWLRFSDENFLLFDVVRSRAYSEIKQSMAAGENSSQLHVRFVNIAALTVRAMQVALEREATQSEELTNVGDDDEGQLP